ncbi:Hypothetical predicted protein [Octopus vulgaris]|uniref:Uncharacterized protein n=2 Tax=Octopus TaxID=6643 RepID=A0AA36FFM0_OCTVU|nr:putative uncharacterized protein DDB_G0277255 [Octopus sinensis]CAI9732773.1 Hypothetical predicted protein [Octopus vulgaris]
MPDSPQTRSSRNNRGHQRVCRVSRSNRSGRSSRVQQTSSSSSSSLSSCSSSNSPLTHTSSINTLSGNAAACGVTSFTNTGLSPPPPPYYPNHTNSSVGLGGFCPVSSTSGTAVTLNGVGPAIQLPQYTVHPCHYALPPYSSAIALTPTNNSAVTSHVTSRPSSNSSATATMTTSPFYGGVGAPPPPPSYTALPRVSSGHHHHRHHTSANANSNNNNNSSNRHHYSGSGNNNSSNNNHHHHHNNNNAMNTGSNASTAVTSASSVSSSSTTLSLGNSGGGGGGGSSGGGGHSSSSLASFSVGHHGYHHLSSAPSSTGGGGGGGGLFSSAASAAAFISSGHHHNHRRLLKHRERNILSAVVSMLVIVVLCTALVEPNWIAVSGGGCKEKHLGVYQFFYPGYFLDHRASLPMNIESNSQTAVEVMVPNEEKSSKMVTGFSYKYGPGNDEVLVDCITLKGVWLMKSIIVFTFLAIAWSLCSFFLDLLGPTQRGLKLIHRNAISSITTVIICVLINGLCYLLTIEVKDLQLNTKPYPGNRVSVTFSVSFYLIATAGGLAVLGTACNCLRHYPVRVTSDPEPLLDDYDRLEQVFYPPGPLPEIASMTPMVPPPAYSP